MILKIIKDRLNSVINAKILIKISSLQITELAKKFLFIFTIKKLEL